MPQLYSREISVFRERGEQGEDVELSRVVTTEEARAGSRTRDSATSSGAYAFVAGVLPAKQQHSTR